MLASADADVAYSTRCTSTSRRLLLHFARLLPHRKMPRSRARKLCSPLVRAKRRRYSWISQLGPTEWCCRSPARRLSGLFLHSGWPGDPCSRTSGRSHLTLEPLRCRTALRCYPAETSVMRFLEANHHPAPFTPRQSYECAHGGVTHWR